MTDTNGYRVLVKEKIADAGVELLREHFEVDVAIDMPQEELAGAIADYDAIVIRSGTTIGADVLEHANRLKVIGRAGIGIDNVDVPAATKRGIIVANAPESNIIAAAEHTIAMILAQARNIPQANASLKAGKWERSRFGGIEVYEKTLGVIGFGRIGQLVAERAKAFQMRVVAHDPYVSAEKYKELGVERMESADGLYSCADIITIHLPKTDETRDYLDAAAFAKMKDGVRIVNCARGELLDHDALEDAIQSGKVAGAGLDVFPEEPMTEHPLFAHESVIVTPHLGASTVEAQDRAGVITAEQVVAALNGDLVSNAVNIPRVHGEDLAVLEPYLPLCRQLGRLAMSLAAHPSVDRIEAAFYGSLADFDTRLLSLAVLQGAFQGRVDEDVNFVNAPTIAEERGIAVSEFKETESHDYASLVSVAVVADGQRTEVGGTTFGPRNVPHLVSLYGQSFNIELAKHLAVFRYSDLPGMIGKVGSVLGERGLNIASTAVGREPDREPGEPVKGGSGALAVMVVTVDSPVPDEVIAEITSLEGFQQGRAVTL
ncbi:MAG: phosphoglycerate dehydrogenase [Solirubrobacterales bacterium]